MKDASISESIIAQRSTGRALGAISHAGAHSTRREYLLYNRVTCSHGSCVRTLLYLALVAAMTITARAQQQEQKLLDRLLKPDMSLESNLQQKQFTAGGATLDKKARTKSFYVRDRKAEKQFVTGNFTTKEFGTKRSRYEQQEANVTSRTTIAKLETRYPAPGYGGVRAARESDKTVEVSDYRDTRPFLVRGKSQKSLSAQDRPLTIDQVRELLNKNK